jgi:hypothetical protein
MPARHDAPSTPPTLQSRSNISIRKALRTPIADHDPAALAVHSRFRSYGVWLCRHNGPVRSQECERREQLITTSRITPRAGSVDDAGIRKPWFGFPHLAVRRPHRAGSFALPSLTSLLGHGLTPTTTQRSMVSAGAEQERRTIDQTAAATQPNPPSNQPECVLSPPGVGRSPSALRRELIQKPSSTPTSRALPSSVILSPLA